MASAPLTTDYKVADIRLADWGAKNRAHPAGPMDFRSLTRNAMVKELEAKYMPADQQRDYETTFGIDTPKK